MNMPSESLPSQARRLVLVGGGALTDSIVSEIARLARASRRGPGISRILVCTLASQDAEAGSRACAAFEAQGLSAAVLDFFPPSGAIDPYETKASSWESLRSFALKGAGVGELCEADALFFTGGDQRLILNVLRGTPFEDTLLARWQSGELLVAGTSAGLQVCSDLALTGDFHGDESSLAGPEGMPANRVALDHVVTAPGLPLLRGVILDQHFLARRRHNRLFSACLDNPGHVGIGVDESTALVVEDSAGTGWARPRVIGASAVFYVDTHSASLQKDASGKPLSVEDLRCGFVWEGGLFPFTLELG